MYKNMMFLKQFIIIQMIKKFPIVMEPDGSSSSPQKSLDPSQTTSMKWMLYFSIWGSIGFPHR